MESKSANGNSHMTHWQAMARPPVTALKEIKGGRLAGMTDVNPQWRYQAMTEQFGMCGVGWKYVIDRLWTEPGCDGEVLAFAQASVFVRDSFGVWGDPVVGIGGNHLITKEKAGLRNNDECWKMAVTDALSVALKMLGVAADVYAGRWDGAKYKDEPPLLAPVERLTLPEGTWQILDVTIDDWGNGSATVVDHLGEETQYPIKTRECATLCEQIQQECIPVVLQRVKGKRDGKVKVASVERWVPAPAPTPMPVTATEIFGDNHAF